MAVRDTIEAKGKIFTGTVATAKAVTQGNIVVNVTASGTVQDGTDTTGIVTLGIALETKAAGEIVKYKRGNFWLANSGSNAVGAGSIGSTCVLEDSITVSTNTTNDIVVGKVLAVDATLGVLVEI